MSLLANSLLGLDLFGSTLTGGLPGSTLSGRAGERAKHGQPFWQHVINFIMMDKNHCQGAIEGDIRRAQAIETDSAR